MSNIGDYEGTHAAFRWETPERFNFGRDVVDRWAAEDRPAMTWLGNLKALCLISPPRASAT